MTINKGEGKFLTALRKERAPATNREKLRKRFLKLADDAQLETATLATMLHSSVARVTAWKREEGRPGANPVPMWAIELLELKLAAMVAAGKTAGTQ